jgi:hypothetical protein
MDKDFLDSKKQETSGCTLEGEYKYVYPRLWRLQPVVHELTFIDDRDPFYNYGEL